MPQSQFTWKGAKSRVLAVKRPCDCGCDQRDGGHGAGYLTGSDAEGNGVSVWIQDEEVFQALRALVAVQVGAYKEVAERLMGTLSELRTDLDANGEIMGTDDARIAAIDDAIAHTRDWFPEDD